MGPIKSRPPPSDKPKLGLSEPNFILAVDPVLWRGGDYARQRWREQNDDISTLMPSLVRYGSDAGIADEQLRKRPIETPLAFLERETGLSRPTIVRARRGQPVHPRSLRLLKDALRKAKHHSSRGIAM